MKFSGITETAIYTDDLITMVDFYESLLGLECIAKNENRSVFFKIGNSILLIFNRNHTVDQTNEVAGVRIPPHATQGPGHFAFEAQPQAYQHCKCEIENKGIDIEAEITWPSGKKSLYFRDPDGNSVEILEHGFWDDQTN